MSVIEYRPDAPYREKVQALVLLFASEVRAPRPSAQAEAVLCRALQDPDWRIRREAANCLETLGTGRAVEPLLAALQQTYPLGASYELLDSFTWGVGVLVFMGSLLSTFFARLPALVAVVALILAWVLHRTTLPMRRDSQLRWALSAALAAITEREPSAVARAAIPELRVASRNFLLQSAASRRACRDAATRIDAATRDLKQLPLAASAPGRVADALPRAADAPQPDPATLPRALG